MSAQAKPTVAVLGTGILGTPIARNLLADGYPVRAWNRTPEKARALAEHGAVAADSPAEAVDGADVVLTVLIDAAATRDAIGAAADRLAPGTIWADMGTLGIADVAPLAALAAEHDLVFVDAPVQGARPLAEQGQLLVYAAGPESARRVLEPIFAVLGRRTDWLDDRAGSTKATAIKLVVNGWLLALTTATAEAVALARGLDLDPERFRAAIEGGPLDNPWAQMKSAAILKDDFAPLFPVRSAAKDAALITAAAESADVRLDVAGAVRERFERAAGNGHAEEDLIATYFASFR
jgi:3-hydroxyisobutyrate dehydrogenase